MKTLLFLFVLSVAVKAETTALKPTKAKKYDVGGFSLYLECYENEHPTLILEQGFGRAGSDGVWLENVAELKDSYSICLYDRSGLGKSDSGPIPVTANQLATQLKTLLAVANVEPPYYFAGGSYASMIITAFNNSYNNEVLGAVFIEPSPFGYFYTMGTRWPAGFKTDNKDLQNYYDFEQSVYDPMFDRAPEKIDHIKSHFQLVNAQNFGNKPVFIVRSKPNRERYDPSFVPNDIAAKMTSLFDSAEEFFMTLSSDARVVYSESGKHHLHIADGELVVETIKDLKNN